MYRCLSSRLDGSEKFVQSYHPALINSDHLKKINKVKKYFHSTIDAIIRYNKLDLYPAHIFVFADVYHAKNTNVSSQLGYLVFLTDYNNWNLFQYKIYK